MNTTIKMTSKGQFTMPVAMRRALNLKEKGDRIVVNFDKRTQRYYIDKPLSLTEINKLNQAVLAKSPQSLSDYRSGDGFRAYAAKKKMQP